MLSEEWEKFFGKYVCDARKIEVFHNGVILPNYQKTDYEDHNVLFLGRLGERKGTYDLLKVIPNVLRKVPDAMFFLGGDGEVEQCRKLAEKTGIAEHVSFLGWVRDAEKEKFLKKCSVFILPSYHEGMPMAVLESMAYGLATISTNAGGIPQIIEQGINGYRIEAGDLKEMENVLIRVLTNTEERERIGNAARIRIAEKFNAERNINELSALYREILYC